MLLAMANDVIMSVVDADCTLDATRRLGLHSWVT